MARKKPDDDKLLSFQQARDKIAQAMNSLLSGNDPGPISFRLKPTKKPGETYLLFPGFFSWASFSLPDWVRWGGVVTGALCSVLMYWTLSSLGKNLTDTVVTRQESTLVTHGPYRWVRHPFYVTAALLMASVTVLTANWLIGLHGAGSREHRQAARGCDRWACGRRSRHGGLL